MDAPMPQPPLEDLDLQSTEEVASKNGARSEHQTDAENALFEWRATYEKRRGLKRFDQWSRYGLRVLATGSLALAALFLIRAPSTEPEASPIEPVVESPGDQQGSLAEDMQTQAPTTWDIGMIDGSLKVWSNENTEWIQFDYAIQRDVYLQWMDESGQMALNSLECTNKLRGGLRRCYIGRSHGRIGIALEHGLASGRWSIQACTEPEGGICMHVANFRVQAEWMP